MKERFVFVFCYALKLGSQGRGVGVGDRCGFCQKIQDCTGLSNFLYRTLELANVKPDYSAGEVTEVISSVFGA